MGVQGGLFDAELQLMSSSSEDLRDLFSLQVLSPSLLLSSLKLNDEHVYEPCIRALLEIASHFCERVVLESRSALQPIWYI